MGKLVYYSAGGAVRRVIHTDASSPYSFTQETTQTYADDFEQRNRELGEMQTGATKVIARGVPVHVYEQSVREGWDEKAWNRWLNDPDNAAFRVWKGTV